MLLMVVLFASGCQDNPKVGDHLLAAESCVRNDGYDYYEYVGETHVIVYCNDGAKFTQTRYQRLAARSVLNNLDTSETILLDKIKVRLKNEQ